MAITDKLQKLIDGKQYVVDKVNAKANSDLKINSTWQSVGDAVEGIQSGGEGVRSLKKLLDYTKSTSSMFSGNITITDLTGYINYSDTSNVTNMSNMFSSCTNLTTIPPLDTSNVTNMSSMFSYCMNLTTIPLFNTSGVTDMSSMFVTCKKLTTIPQFNTNNVTKISNMFSNCNSLTRIDFSHYNISSISNNGFWCSACKSLKTLIIRSFGTAYTLNTNAFNNCYHLLGTVDVTYNPNGDKDCYIYVPRSMVDTLKSATNWSKYADQFRALEDYTVDGTTTGDLDESKVNA